MKLVFLFAFMLSMVFGGILLAQRHKIEYKKPKPTVVKIEVSPPGPGLVIHGDYISYQRYHTLSDGAQVGQIGALQYLITPDKQAYSDGYQSIEPAMNGYTAKIGSEIFHLDHNGQPQPHFASGK